MRKSLLVVVVAQFAAIFTLPFAHASEVALWKGTMSCSYGEKMASSVYVTYYTDGSSSVQAEIKEQNFFGPIVSPRVNYLKKGADYFRYGVTGVVLGSYEDPTLATAMDHLKTVFGFGDSVVPRGVRVWNEIRFNVANPSASFVAYTHPSPRMDETGVAKMNYEWVVSPARCAVDRSASE